jgi:hypothetical protein
VPAKCTLQAIEHTLHGRDEHMSLYTDDLLPNVCRTGLAARHAHVVSWQSSQHRISCIMLSHRGHWGTGLPPTICTVTSEFDKGSACRSAGRSFTALGQTNCPQHANSARPYIYLCMVLADTPQQLTPSRVEEMAQAKGDAMVMHGAAPGQAHSTQTTRTPRPNQNKAKPPLAPVNRD